ncbi:MAG: cytochrome c3 family protein, partial [Mariprofundaceae bacterium]
GGNQQEPNLPLWNHTIPDKSTFSIYESTALNKMQGAMSTPGPASLTCLSCHDGTIAIDSIINMPTTATSAGNGGSTMWLEGTPGQAAFLGSWSGGPVAGIHMPLGYVGGPGFACEFCHTGVIAPDFSVFAIGKNLTNDHPVGVVYPTTFGPDVHFNQPSDTTADGRIKYFEDVVGSSGAPSTNNNNHLNVNEIRLYNSGDGFEVECASCHDPHGVTSDGSAPWGGSFDTAGLSRSGVAYNTSFLRISNSDSDVCLTCHDK